MGHGVNFSTLVSSMVINKVIKLHKLQLQQAIDQIGLLWHQYRYCSLPTSTNRQDVANTISKVLSRFNTVMNMSRLFYSPYFLGLDCKTA